MIDHYNKNPTLDDQKVRLTLKQNKITRIPWLLAIVFVVSCLKYQPPENLRLLLEMDGYTLYCPVWSPAGKIYFIITNTHLGELEYYFGGSLWVCDTSGESPILLIDGKFGHLDISADGSKLILTGGYLFKEWDYDGGPLIIADSSGHILDTILTSEPKVVSAKLSNDGDKIYYYAQGGALSGIYRINIDGTNEEFLEGAGWPKFFDITPGGRILAYEDVIPNLSPMDSNLMVWAGIPTSPLVGCELYLHNFTTQEDSALYVKPFKGLSSSTFPYWSPEGSKIVFTAASCRGDAGSGYGSLWILDLTKEE